MAYKEIREFLFFIREPIAHNVMISKKGERERERLEILTHLVVVVVVVVAVVVV